MEQNNIRNIKPGDCIREKVSVREMGSYHEEIHHYRVLAVYPYHVLAVDAVTGARRSICYGDLIIAGLEEQSPSLEALRKDREDSKGRWEI